MYHAGNLIQTANLVPRLPVAYLTSEKIVSIFSVVLLLSLFVCFVLIFFIIISCFDRRMKICFCNRLLSDTGLSH